MELMSQAAYARHRGVTRQAINKAINAKKIQLREKDGRKGIDPAEADRALGLNVQRVLAEDDGDNGREVSRQAPGLTQARTATEVYKARLAELDYNERLGKLRPVEQIEMGAQRCAETMLRAIEGIVGRADDLAAQVTKEGVSGARAALRVIVRDLRGVASREFARLASGELGEMTDEDESEA